MSTIDQIIMDAMAIMTPEVEKRVSDVTIARIAEIVESMHSDGIDPKYQEVLLTYGVVIGDCIRAREALADIRYVAGDLASISRLLDYADTVIKGVLMSANGVDCADAASTVAEKMQELTEAYRMVLQVNRNSLPTANRCAEIDYATARSRYAEDISDESTLQCAMQCHTVAGHLYKRGVFPAVTYVDTLAAILELGVGKPAVDFPKMYLIVAPDIMSLANHLNAILDEVNAQDLKVARAAMNT